MAVDSPDPLEGDLPARIAAWRDWFAEHAGERTATLDPANDPRTRARNGRG